VADFRNLLSNGRRSAALRRAKSRTREEKPEREEGEGKSSSVEDGKRFQRATLFRRVPCISSSLLSPLFSLSILSFFFSAK